MLRLFLFVSFVSTCTSALGAELVFRMGKSPRSLSTAVLKPVSKKKVSLLPQIGIRDKKKRTVEVALDSATRFWNTSSSSQKFKVSPGKTEWLWLYVPMPSFGSLGIHPAPEFRIDGARPAVFNSTVSPIDTLRNEYIAAAVEIGNINVISAIYGPEKLGKPGTVRAVLRDLDFQDFDGDEIWVDQFVSSVDRLRSRGCDVGDGSGDYAYPVYLDVDQRLEKATKRIVSWLTDHFYKRAKENGIEITKAEIQEYFRVTSGYRNPARNRCIGGSELSRHQMGLALDLSFVPNSQGASDFAERIGMDLADVWNDYAEVAGKALVKGKAPKSLCRSSLLGKKAKRFPSRFSDYKVVCGCESGAEWVNCTRDIDLVDHVHVSF